MSPSPSPLACCVTPAHFHLCTQMTEEALSVSGVREEQSRSCHSFTEPPTVWDTNTLTYHDYNYREGGVSVSRVIDGEIENDGGKEKGEKNGEKRDS